MLGIRKAFLSDMAQYYEWNEEGMLKAWTIGNSGALIFCCRWSGGSICSWRTAPKWKASDQSQATSKAERACMWPKQRGWWLVCCNAEGPQWRSWVTIHSLYSCSSWPTYCPCEDHQISDLVRFCTSSTEFGILTVDPTFSPSNFDVTPITYRHLLSTKRNENTPVFWGPVLYSLSKYLCHLFIFRILTGRSI